MHVIYLITKHKIELNIFYLVFAVNINEMKVIFFYVLFKTDFNTLKLFWLILGQKSFKVLIKKLISS